MSQEQEGWSDSLACPRCNCPEVFVLREPEVLDGLKDGVIIKAAWHKEGKARCDYCGAEFLFVSREVDEPEGVA
jgi:hypothetical protein